MCDCLLRQFAKLGEGEQGLLGAMLRADTAAIPALSAALTPEAVDRVDAFVTRETLLCRPSG